MSAIGDNARLSASFAIIRTTAAAPSEIELALAAVTEPSVLNADFNRGILSGLALPGCSSVLTTISPCRLDTVTGVISSTKYPFEIAILARCRDSRAYLS